jgi:hypothetical protein
MAAKKLGRPAVTIDPAQVEKLASRWMTKDAIADFLGIARSTFYDKMRADPQIEVAWHRGRATLQAKSMDWLVASAQNGSVRAQTFLAERICGLKETVTHEGEVTARYVVELPAEVPLQSWQQTFRPRDPDEHDPGNIH